MKCIRRGQLLAVTAALALTLPAMAAVEVQLELNQQFFYEGDSLEVRVTVRNTGDTEIPNPIEKDLFTYLVAAESSGKTFDVPKKGLPSSPDRPAKLEPGSFYGGVVDATKLFPELQEVGKYRLHWSGGGLLSEQYRIQVIPKFDPTKRYSFQMDTSEGEIVIDLFQDRAPVASKALVDLAHSDFYDGLQFQEVRADEFIVGGNPAAVGRPQPGFRFPSEVSAQPIVAGSVLMKPISASPPANGTEFIISLKPQVSWQGQVTVVGQVRKGLDIVQKISRAANSGARGNPPFRPTTAIRIDDVQIVEQKPAGASGN